MRKQIAALHFARVSALVLVAITLLSMTPLYGLAVGNLADDGVTVSDAAQEPVKTYQTNPREKDMTATSKSVARSNETNPREKDMTATSKSVARSNETNPREKDMTATSKSVARSNETNPREKDMTFLGHTFA